MRSHSSEISIPLTSIQDGLCLFIYEEAGNTLFEIDESEAVDFGESRYQLLEGRSYNYYFDDTKYQLKEQAGIVLKSKRIDVSEGRITPNIYVGTLTLYVTKQEDSEFEYPVQIEVLATKMNGSYDVSYRENYRYMLENITEKCTELLMQINSPVSQHFEPNFDKESQTTYQRFAFVQSLISSVEFNEAVQKIVSSPATHWTEDLELKDVRSLKRFNGSSVRRLVSGNNRFPLPEDHFLTNEYGLKDIPSKILSSRKVETLDTPENRFVKYALEVFLKFCENCERSFAFKKEYERSQKEALSLIKCLAGHLNHPIFREVSRPVTLKLNSPLLQKKSGYREILKSWLMFDLASRLIWTGGENVYEAGKRDIAVLYEYWLFFALYDLMKDKFALNLHSYEDKPYDHLIVPTNDGLNIMVKSGKHTALEGVFNSGVRNLHIKFSYNRTFSGGKDYMDDQNNKVGGSWTKTLRPDYTLSIWPAEFLEEVAEEKEIIVHIHFDSKYKVDQFFVKPSVISDTTKEAIALDEEKTDERKGIYKNADLLKMHAYKDAIRRTSGAYILYPGTENQEPLRGFHEIIPGLGAFAVRPSSSNSGIEHLSDFIDKVIKHFLDRASQRENISSKVYQVHKIKKKDLSEDNRPNILNEPMPEMIDGVKLIPDETFVLVGYYKTQQQLTWILEKGKYNFRTGLGKGSLALGQQELGAKFLVLHGPTKTKTEKIYHLKDKGPKIYSKQDLIDEEYPTMPTGDAYIMFEIEKEISKEFAHVTFDLTKLSNFKNFWESALPITVSLTELMKVVFIKQG